MPSRARREPPHNLSQTNFEHLLFEDVQSASDGITLRESLLPPLPRAPEFLPIFAVRLVRADSIKTEEKVIIRSPRDAASIAWKHLQHSDREEVVSILVDTKGGVIGLNIVSVGDLSSAIIHPREVFKAAILANAASIILTHNHPSGDPQPSPEDIAVSRRIADAGEILGIELLDHVVIGNANRFTSLKERGHF